MVVGATLKGFHDWTLVLGPNFMLGINTFLYSYVFFVSGLVPKPIALPGLTAATLIFLVSLLELFRVVQQVSVAGWLIRKGFNLSRIQPIRLY